MPVYEEMVKDKTGKLVPKLIDRQKVYYIRTYVTDEFGKRKQITRHNKNWIGIDGKREAIAEENKLVNKQYNQYENMTLNELFNAYFKYIEKT